MATSQVEIWALPDEVLCYIFSKLNSEFVIKCVANVCQRWKNVVTEEKLFWNDVQVIVDCDYFFNYSYIDDSLAKYAPSFITPSEGIYVGEKDLNRAIKIQNIKFTEGSKIGYLELIRILDSFRKNCHSIESVEFFSCFIAASIEVIEFLRKNFNKIKEIRYGIYKWYAPIFPYNEVSRFTNLRTLVAHDRSFNSSALRDLSRGCEYLSSLWILLCKSIMEEDILYFLENKKNTLKELGFGSSLNDKILNKLKECRSLEVLFATDAGKVTDVCLKSFAYQSNLKYCSLHDANIQWTTVTDIAGLSREPSVFQHLMIFDLTHYNNYQAEYSRSWGGSCERSNNDTRSSITKKSNVEVTFNNPYRRSIERPHFSPSSKEHWMYRHRNK